MSHKPRDASHKAENATETGSRSAESASPAQLPAPPAASADSWSEKNLRSLESELEAVRKNQKSVNAELRGFAARLEGATDPDQKYHLTAKSKIFQHRRRVLVKQEELLLRKL